MSESCAIGLDIGGTKMAGGIVSFPSGQILARQVTPTLPKRGGEAVLADALTLAKTLMAQAKVKDLVVQGIGVGVAELVDPTGNVTSAHTIDWLGLSAQDAFAKLAPAVIESDVRAPAMAEAAFGAGRPYQTFAYVTIGTGISYCLVQDGKPYTGARGNALVLTSGPLTAHCPVCGTVSQTVVEEVASGPALVMHYNKHSPTPVTQAEAVLEAIEAGDIIALRIVARAAEVLGSSLGFMANLLDPEAIIVGGGLGLAGGIYWDTLIDSTRRHIYAETTRNLPIHRAVLGVDAGLIGAAAAVYLGRNQEEAR